MPRKQHLQFEELIRNHNHACFAGKSDKISSCFSEIAAFLQNNDPDPKFLDLTFSADAPEVAALILSIHPTDTYKEDFLKTKDFPYPHFHFLHSSCDVNFMRLLKAAGMPMENFALSFSYTAFLKDDLRFLEFCEDILNKQITIFEDIDSHKSIIPKCGPNFAPRVLSELPNYDTGYIARSWSSTHKMPLKALSLWALEGKNFTEWLNVIDEKHRWIAELTGSNHGRLQLRNYESSALDVLSRPKESKFFGLDGTI